ncbi:hypothetical protein ACQ9Z2_001018 [Escherichia coli]
MTLLHTTAYGRKSEKTGGMIVSCQPVQAGPMDDPEIITAMADCSSEQDGLECYRLGAEIIGTTLSGYTGAYILDASDLDLVRRLSKKGCRVIAEGRYNTPASAAAAMEHGARAVTVGSAITRLEHICHWYCKAMQEAVR